MKDKDRLKTYSRWKAANETSQVNATCDVILGGILNQKGGEAIKDNIRPMGKV